METKALGLRAIMPGLKKPRKPRKGKPKYPITTLDVGQAVTIQIESPAHEKLLRKSADNWNLRNLKNGFIRTSKKDDQITFTRMR